MAKSALNTLLGSSINRVAVVLTTVVPVLEISDIQAIVLRPRPSPYHVLARLLPRWKSESGSADRRVHDWQPGQRVHERPDSPEDNHG